MPAGRRGRGGREVPALAALAAGTRTPSGRGGRAAPPREPVGRRRAITPPPPLQVALDGVRRLDVRDAALGRGCGGHRRRKECHPHHSSVDSLLLDRVTRARGSSPYRPCGIDESVNGGLERNPQKYQMCDRVSRVPTLRLHCPHSCSIGESSLVAPGTRLTFEARVGTCRAGVQIGQCDARALTRCAKAVTMCHGGAEPFGPRRAEFTYYGVSLKVWWVARVPPVGTRFTAGHVSNSRFAKTLSPFPPLARWRPLACFLRLAWLGGIDKNPRPVGPEADFGDPRQVASVLGALRLLLSSDLPREGSDVTHLLM